MTSSSAEAGLEPVRYRGRCQLDVLEVVESSLEALRAVQFQEGRSKKGIDGSCEEGGGQCCPELDLYGLFE